MTSASTAIARDAAASRARLAPGAAVGVTEEMIAAVVHAFYARVRRDPALGPVFARAVPDAAWPGHLERMCDFWSSVLLMTGRFKGAPVPAHVAIDGINARHFARWLHLFGRAAAETCPPAAAALFVAKAQIIAQSLQLAIAAARSELPPPRAGGSM
jgi:hemoglobin